MTCSEFQEILPDVVEGVRRIDHESHLKTCSSCLDLVADLETILREARQLEGLYEPSPQVWTNIENTLRMEGIIREPQRSPALVPPFRRRWFSPWVMAPAGALALIAMVIFYQRQQPHPAEVAATPQPVVMAKADNTVRRSNPADIRRNQDDHRLLEQVSFPTPAVREVYESNLRDVNAYIDDAEASARQDPNDEEAQLSLMNAYAQRSMVYEMAMDRSLP
jgi:hypothetical protein